MKKNTKIVIVFLLIVVGLRVCLSNNKKKDKAILKTSSTVVPVTISTNFNNPLPVHPNVFGVNIGFAFARELDKDSGFVQLLREMRPVSLRFPGGTVANWYHPHLPVYGYKANEIISSLGGLYALQSKRSENILYNFIRLCKQVNCGAVYCANLLNGTTEEILFVINELKKNNIPIYGVELGNEFCLLPYREKYFTTEQVYIDKIRKTASVIREKYPDLKLAVVAGEIVPDTEKGQRATFMRQWNKGLSKENFYEAYVYHYYAACSDCDKDAYFDNIYTRNLSSLAPFQTNKLMDIGTQYLKFYGKEKKLWLTEWNISNGEYLDNTFTQAAFVSENFLNMIALNTQYNNYFELSNLHVMDGLINNFKGKQKPVFPKGNNYATVQYFAFKFLASTLTKDTYRGNVNIMCMDNAVLKNFVCNAFVNDKEKTIFLHFINRSGHKIQLTLDAKRSNYTLNAIEADVPYATAGKTTYEKKYPNKIKPVRLREEKIDGNIISIAPYSFGYISYAN